VAEVGIVVIYVNNGPGVGRRIALLLDTATDVVVDCALTSVVVATVDQLEPKGQNQDSPHENVNCLNTMH
jgi:hypothetical protein